MVSVGWVMIGNKVVKVWELVFLLLVLGSFGRGLSRELFVFEMDFSGVKIRGLVYRGRDEDLVTGRVGREVRDEMISNRWIRSGG